MATIGGNVYGQGLHGRTIDVIPLSKDDKLNMVSTLSSASRSPAWIAYVFDAPSSSRKSSTASTEARKTGLSLKKKRMTAVEMDALVAALRSEPSFKTMVAKETTETASFEEELKMNDRILRAYGTRGAAEFTTLRVVEFKGKQLAGIRVPSEGLHYTLQTRCQKPLDKFKFEEPSQVRAFLRDIVASFDRLHRAGFLHADVKRDNMIFCADGAPHKFRLIDWGSSTSAERLRKAYLSDGTYARPKNCLSPIAWFVYGAAPVAKWITFGRAAMLHGAAFATSPEFRQFATEAVETAKECVDRIVDETNEEGFASIQQLKARRLAFDRHWKSFDLFNLGLIVAEIACTTPGGQKDAKLHARCMRIAKKLVQTF